ncbi:transposase [Apiospora phragmitis]|uniref:Transposase n=1 Tax=Apiospora phragmitis TaxID=2905665 RepID=A0ABR1X797_9PEZI
MRLNRQLQQNKTLDAVCTGASLRGAAKSNGTTHWSLRRRLEGVPTFEEKYTSLQALSPVQETFKRRVSRQFARFFRSVRPACGSRHTPEHSYNVDKVGSAMGIGDNPLVIGPAELRKVFMKDPNRLDWVTVLECISGSGRAITPLVIFAGKHIQQQWFRDEFDPEIRDWRFTASPNGWTSNQIALDCLNNVFIRETKPDDPDQWRHLILDGHRSHTTEEFKQACLTAKIWINYLPAHTSQVSQPLDVGPFSVLKRKFRAYLRDACFRGLTMAPGHEEFVDAWKQARKDAFTVGTIKAGWQYLSVREEGNSATLNSTTPIDLLSEITSAAISTLKSARDVNNLARTMVGVDEIYDQPTARLLFRKLAKALTRMRSGSVPQSS